MSEVYRMNVVAAARGGALGGAHGAMVPARDLDGASVARCDNGAAWPHCRVP